MIIRQWAAEFGVPMHALLELERRLSTPGQLTIVPVTIQGEPGSESRQSSLVRLEAAQKDVMLFRNQVGAFQNEAGRWVRVGLANESEKQNKIIKSADFIGWRAFIIQPHHVGLKCAQFVSREIKAEDWVPNYSDPHTAAQVVWRDLVNADGGDAAIVTGPGTL